MNSFKKIQRHSIFQETHFHGNIAGNLFTTFSLFLFVDCD